MKERENNEQQLESWRPLQGAKLYQIDLITENFVILSAVHGNLDDGMIIRLEEFDMFGLKKVNMKEKNK